MIVISNFRHWVAS